MLQIISALRLPAVYQISPPPPLPAKPVILDPAGNSTGIEVTLPNAGESVIVRSYSGELAHVMDGVDAGLQSVLTAQASVGSRRLEADNAGKLVKTCLSSTPRPAVTLKISTSPRQPAISPWPRWPCKPRNCRSARSRACPCSTTSEHCPMIKPASVKPAFVSCRLPGGWRQSPDQCAAPQDQPAAQRSVHWSSRPPPLSSNAF